MQSTGPDLQVLANVRGSLLRLYWQAREIREHQVAYHVLAAVMHAAESLRQVEILDEVAALAREHGKSIDQGEPGHPLSAQSASVRGHPGIFEQLAAMCAAVRARIKAEDLHRK
ncbi:MAG TPA: hypothetical protein VH600_06345 [Burkholderiales bacterium]|jgi:DNA-binding IclR family transcriptional regulator